MSWSDYFDSYNKQVDYAKKTLNIDYKPHEMCVNCVVNHTLNKSLKWKINCKPLRHDTFEQEVTEDNVLELQASDQSYFVEYILGIKPRTFQKEIISCTQSRKALRIQRRQGKSHAMAMYMLWFQITKPKQSVRVVAPREIHIRELFDKMDNMIKDVPLVKQQVIKTGKTHLLYKKNPYELSFTNGSSIRGITTSDSDGTSVRSQSANLLVMDEADYVSDEQIAAIFPLIASSNDTEFLISSTPSGRRSYFYNWCYDPAYKELHKQYQDIETYSPENDLEFQRTFEKEKYEREILAKFTLQESGVFPNEILDEQIEKYEFDNVSDVVPGTYTIGVDWNESVAGVHIVVSRYEPHHGKYRISNIEVINPSEFTQLIAIDRIIELYEIYKPKKIVVDEGFGITQIQALKRWGVEHPNSGFREALTIIPFGGKIHHYDPITGQMIDTYTKPFLVQLQSRMLENKKIILPASEDFKQRLVGQMRDYRVLKVTETGMPKYSKGNVHTLEAMFLQLYGMWLIKEELQQARTTIPIYNEHKKIKNEKDETPLIRTGNWENSFTKRYKQIKRLYRGGRRW